MSPTTKRSSRPGPITRLSSGPCAPVSSWAACWVLAIATPWRELCALSSATVGAPTARPPSGVDALAVEGVRALDDEVLARRDLGAHQQLEDPLRGLGVRHRDAAQGAVPRVHRGLRQLVGVHLAEALVALDRLLVAPVPLGQAGQQ